MSENQVIVRLKGGLGNQLFQYAVGRHLSMLLDADLVLDCSFLDNRVFIPNTTHRTFELGMFSIRARLATERDIPLYSANAPVNSLIANAINYLRLRLKGVSYVQETRFQYQKEILQTNASRLYLNGYWQSYKYFEGISTVIRREFALTKMPVVPPTLLQQIKSEQSVCIHVRRTDYLQTNFYPVLGLDYVQAAIQEVLLRVKAPTFFVFSDDIAWCRQHLQSGKYATIFVDNEQPGTKADFYLMCHCKHFIIANSTFSWWAAWLSKQDAKKIVIAPKRWFTAAIDTNDLIPEGWMRV